MKFLDSKGKVQEGTPLTDEQAAQRDNLIVYFHENACNGSYHASYQTERACEVLANDFVTGAITKAANAQPEVEEEKVEVA